MRGRGNRLPPMRYMLLAIFTVLAGLFIVAPLAVVVLNSFSSVSYNVFPPEGYSLRWYRNLAEQHAFYGAAVRSVVLALIATAVSLVVGTMAAYALVRYPLRASDAIKAFLLSPIVMPKIVLGVALFMFYVQVGSLNSYWSLVVTHAVVTLPFVIAIVSASLISFDWTMQEAAMDLGAGPLYTFFRVILPQISVSMSVAAVFSFIISFDQVETTVFLVRPASNTLPIEMFLYLQKWQDPTIAALSTVLIVIAIILVVILTVLIGKGALPSNLAPTSKKDAP
jgi:putative spermidine/putrescine transport system permease protein